MQGKGMKKLLNELIKPPFTVNDYLISDKNKVVIVELPNKIWLCEYGKDLLRFIHKAITEKWNREYGKKKSWIKHNENLQFMPEWECPYCSIIFEVSIWKEWKFKYCPYCGIRLDHPGVIKK